MFQLSSLTAAVFVMATYGDGTLARSKGKEEGLDVV